MKNLRILLIEPPFFRLYDQNYSLNKYPLSLGYLAAAIKKDTSHDVQVYNADFTSKSSRATLATMVNQGHVHYISNLNDPDFFVWKEIREVIKQYNPDVVGITSKSQNFASAKIVASICKKVDKNIIVVLGGPHVCMVGREVLISCDIDLAVKGEGEVTFVELVNCIAEKRDLFSVAGLIYRNKFGIVTVSQDREFIKELDDLDSPYLYARQVLKDFEKYPVSSFRSIFATRGCPYNCIFCGSGKIWQHKVRFRSTQNVAGEIKLLQGMGVNYFNFDDDTFGITKKYISELCDELKKTCKGIHWSCEMHVNLINSDNLKAMKEAGCDLIKIGIESGNNEMLKKIRKNITIEEAYSACELIQKNKMHVMAFFMVGFPEETEETLQDTVKAIKKTPGYVEYSIFTPYRGTDAFDITNKFGLIPYNFDPSLYNHTSPDNNFSINIKHERFREIASEIEKIADRKNKQYASKVSLARFFPSNIFRKIYAMGAAHLSK